ncbi:MAG TPA: putative ABC exporter domain-containing protein [Steroidobacteraceae bacterium]|nr:putative ABC exporter domain-containing protein [Steroidobacteraceae bacterium]
MSGIASALFYLRMRSLENALVSRVKRLKQPKYLIGALVGGAYIYFFFLRRLGANNGRASEQVDPQILVQQLPAVANVAALLLMIVILFYWILPRSRAALTFSEAEIAFLFPAPVHRRTLIHYRLINLQFRLAFTALIFGLISRTWSFLPGDWVIRAFGWWIILGNIALHDIASSFTITRLLERGMGRLRRQLVSFAAIVIGIGVLAMWTRNNWSAPRSEDLESAHALMTYLGTQLAAEPLSWLLLPAKWVVQPALAPDLSSFFKALVPALCVYAAHYVWVLRAEVSFEEASIAKAAKKATQIAAMRSGNLRLGTSAPKPRSAPFRLRRFHPPEVAFLWKNLLASAEYLRPRTALIAAIVVVAGCEWLRQGEHESLRPFVSIFALVIAAYTLVFGPMFARQDLRTDIANSDLLKTYPLRGWQIVLGEMLAPIAILTMLQWLLLLAGSLTFDTNQTPWLTPGMHIAATVGVALLMPFLCAIQVLVMNAAVVLFPAWMRTTQDHSTGIDAMGQRILFVSALVLAMLAAMLPAAVGGGLVFLLCRWLIGPVTASAAGTVFALVILYAEVGFGVQWVGERFERFDLSAELRA